MPETNIYDYEFSVRESEPKRAEMLNRLKDRVQHVDKKEIISSDEFVEGESNFSEDKALSVFLLNKLFPSKAKLLKDHYTKDQVDSLLSDLIAKYYLKDQIDSLLANLKNELKSSLDANGSEAVKKLNDLKTELSKHRTLEELDHPDASVTTRKLRDHSVTKEKLSTGLSNELDSKANKAGDTFTGLVTFNEGLRIQSINADGSTEYHSISYGGIDTDGKRNLDIGTFDTTYEANLCCIHNPGWYDANRNFHRFLTTDDLGDIQNRINNLPKGGGSTTFAKISANKIWSGRVTVRNKIRSNSKPKFKVCDLPANWNQIIIYSSIEQRASDNDDGWYNYMTNCFAILIKDIAADVIAGYQGIQEVKSFFVEGNTLYMRGLTPNGDNISVFNL